MLARRLLLAAPILLLRRPARAQTLRRAVWHDPARQRDIPVLIRAPETAAPAPAVIISHGLGGSREGLAYLGIALAEAGFCAVHLQHAGTDTAVWRGAADPRAAMAAAATDVGLALARLQDAVFALDRLAAPDGPLAGQVDPARLGAAGHSYGAWTVQALAGERLPGGDRGLGLPDPRLKAGVLLSPIPQALPPRIAFSRIHVPLLHVTGTRDSGMIESATPEARLRPYAGIAGAPQMLVVLDGARHASFAGEAGAGGGFGESPYHRRTAALASLFLRATLAGAPIDLPLEAQALLDAGDRLESKGFR